MTTLPDILPYDDDSFDRAAPQKPGQQLLGLDFAYIGAALTGPEFVAYLAGYNFGTVPPDFVCLHHTAVPTLPGWCANESGLGDTGIRNKRLTQLSRLRDFYEGKGWQCGPHLFIDDRFIYLFTPMNQVGIHAKWGNSYRAHGQLHYSIGIEIIGDYSRQIWGTPIARNVAGAVRALQTRLKTFELKYLYPTPASKPGMVGTGDAQRCAHPERLRFGGIASHRDFNKPECPGTAITEAFYIAVLNADEMAPITQPPVPSLAPLDAGATLLHAPRASQASSVAWLRRYATGGYTLADVRAIVAAYFAVCATAGIDPLLAIAQMAHETGSLTSWWSQRPRRNPAGIGVTGVGGAGLSFASWANHAIPAHIGRLLAYALDHHEGTPAQQQLIASALALRGLPSASRGTARQLGGLDGRWAVPGIGYGAKIATIANAIREMAP